MCRTKADIKLTPGTLKTLVKVTFAQATEANNRTVLSRGGRYAEGVKCLDVFYRSLFVRRDEGATTGFCDLYASVIVCEGQMSV